MVYPYLTYCSVMWTSTYPTGLKPILTIQKQLEQIMTFSKNQDKSKPLFQCLKILDIHELNMYLITLLMYSYFSNILAKYFNDCYTLNKNIHSHNTRSASNIFIDYKRTNYGKFSLKYRNN